MQQIILIFSGQVAKRRFVAPNAFAIEICQIVQERSLILVCVGSQHEIDIAVHERLLGAGSVRRGDDEVAERDERFILVLIQEERLPSGCREVFRGVNAALGWRQLG